ncbi:hypothetical protein Nmel_013120 [Mimus melanotis]
MGTKLFLFRLQLRNSGHYRCVGLVGSEMSLSAPVTVTVHELFSLSAGAGGSCELTEGAPLNLSCIRTPSPLRPPDPPPVQLLPGQAIGGGACRGPHISWCPPWGSPIRGITAARCPPRGMGRAEEQRPARRHGAQ